MEYAGFWRRAAATILDGLIISLVVSALRMVGMSGFGDSDGVKGFFDIAEFFIGWLYGAGMESSERQATFGKQIMGIRVTDLEGNRISFARATGRYFGKIISGLLLGIGFIMAAFTEKKQALHDKLANCLVVRG